jgi:hypothetical protein
VVRGSIAERTVRASMMVPSRRRTPRTAPRSTSMAVTEESVSTVPPGVLDMPAKRLREHAGASPGALDAGFVDQTVEEAHERRTGGRRGKTRRDRAHGEGEPRLGCLEEPVDELPATRGGNAQ